MKNTKPSSLIILASLFITGFFLIFIHLHGEEIFTKGEVYMGEAVINLPKEPNHEIIKGETTNTFVDHDNGFEFSYPKTIVVKDDSNINNLSLVFYKSGEYVGTILSSKGGLYSPPKGAKVKDWVMKDSEYHLESLVYGDGPDTNYKNYFLNKIGPTFSIDGLDTLHLMSNSAQGGRYDSFYIIKNNKLFVVQVASPYDTDPKTGYIKFTGIDMNSNDWYVQVLKSFKFK